MVPCPLHTYMSIAALRVFHTDHIIGIILLSITHAKNQFGIVSYVVVKKKKKKEEEESKSKMGQHNTCGEFVFYKLSRMHSSLGHSVPDPEGSLHLNPRTWTVALLYLTNDFARL